MLIREATDDELDKVSSLLSAAWDQYHAPPDASEARREGFAEYKASVADVWSRLEDSFLLVAVDGDARIVGTVTYYPPRAGEPAGEGWPVGWAAIRLLGVHPDARGSGTGRLLTEECLRRARADGATHVGLHTADIMAIARAMYQRMGFVRYRENDFVVDDKFTVEAYVLELA